MMLYCLVEELFSLGPQELGCLKDKGQSGAKVGFCPESCCTKCENQCLIDNGKIQKHRDSFSIHLFRSEWSHWSCRDCLPPCYWRTNRVPQPLISLTVLAGIAVRSVSFLALKRHLFSARPCVKFSFACYVIMWTAENTVLGLDIVCSHMVMNYMQLWRYILLHWPQGTNQHDVQELNRILFSALEHSLVGTSGSTFIQQLYHGTIVNSIVCKDCGNISQRQVCVCIHFLVKVQWQLNEFFTFFCVFNRRTF